MVPPTRSIPDRARRCGTIPKTAQLSKAKERAVPRHVPPRASRPQRPGAAPTQSATIPVSWSRMRHPNAAPLFNGWGELNSYALCRLPLSPPVPPRCHVPCIGLTVLPTIGYTAPPTSPQNPHTRDDWARVVRTGDDGNRLVICGFWVQAGDIREQGCVRPWRVGACPGTGGPPRTLDRTGNAGAASAFVPGPDRITCDTTCPLGLTSAPPRAER